jgi:hypothetical protein
MPGPVVRRAVQMVRVLGLIAVLLCVAGRAAEACTCGAEPTAREAVGLADAVLVGTVVDQRAYVHVEGICTGPAIVYDVVVHRAWKGLGDRRISLRRVSACSAAFGVGTTWLIYAMRSNGQFYTTGCLPNRRVDGVSSELWQLGAPEVRFEGSAAPVATSLPLSRWLRAHVVGGVGHYAYWWANQELVAPPRDLIVAAWLAGLIAGAAFVQAVRRRWRAGAWLLAGSAAVLAAHVFWTGHVFLNSGWSEPFLRW